MFCYQLTVDLETDALLPHELVSDDLVQFQLALYDLVQDSLVPVDDLTK